MKHKTFTMIELLVVVAVLGILVSLLSPSIKSSLEVAYKTKCGEQMKTIHMAQEFYHDDKGSYSAIWFHEPPRRWGIWVEMIWSYAGLNQNEYSWNNYSHRQNTKANLFHCPITSEEVKPSITWEPYSEAGRESSYAYNASPIWRNTPGMYWQDRWRAPLQSTWIDTPNQTMMLMDHQHHVIAILSQYTPNAIAPHLNQVNAVYYDGHLESKFHLDIPKDLEETFWSGH